MVEVANGSAVDLLPVDGDGVWLPGEDFSQKQKESYPCLAGIDRRPIQPVGILGATCASRRGARRLPRPCRRFGSSSSCIEFRRRHRPHRPPRRPMNSSPERAQRSFGARRQDRRGGRANHGAKSGLALAVCDGARRFGHGASGARRPPHPAGRSDSASEHQSPNRQRKYKPDASEGGKAKAARFPPTNSVPPDKPPAARGQAVVAAPENSSSRRTPSCRFRWQLPAFLPPPASKDRDIESPLARRLYSAAWERGRG